MFNNLGTIEAPMVTSSNGVGGNPFGFFENIMTRDSKIKTFDAAVESGRAFLVSELEKRDYIIREPLTSVTYPRDIPMSVGGGWVDHTSSMNVDYGVTNGTNGSLWHADESNLIPVIQANLDKDVYNAHIFSIALRTMFVDLQKSNYIGRSLDSLLRRGIRLAYDKHMDAHVYIGTEEYGTTGLVNNPNVVTSNVDTGVSGSTQWSTKTPNEILADINSAILTAWEASGYDPSAIPNHILLPYQQYTYLATTRVSELAEKTILTFLMENNISTQNGGTLVIGATRYLEGAGASGTNRMVVYVNDRNFLLMEELVPLKVIMTGQNISTVSYDTIFMANMSDIQLYYTSTIAYFDGI